MMSRLQPFLALLFFFLPVLSTSNEVVIFRPLVKRTDERRVIDLNRSPPIDHETKFAVTEAGRRKDKSMRDSENRRTRLARIRAAPPNERVALLKHGKLHLTNQEYLEYESNRIKKNNKAYFSRPHIREKYKSYWRKKYAENREKLAERRKEKRREFMLKKQNLNDASISQPSLSHAKEARLRTKDSMGAPDSSSSNKPSLDEDPGSTTLRLRKRASFPDPDPFHVDSTASAAASKLQGGIHLGKDVARPVGKDDSAADSNAAATAAAAAQHSMRRAQYQEFRERKRQAQLRYISKPDKRQAKRDHDRLMYHTNPERKEKLLQARAIREAIKFQNELDDPAAQRAADRAKVVQLAQRRQRYHDAGEDEKERRRIYAARWRRKKKGSQASASR